MSDWWSYGYAGMPDVEGLRRAQLGSTLARIELSKRVRRLEDELAWTSTVSQALTALCIEKGIVVEEELTSRIARLEESRAAAAAEAAKTVLPPRRPRRRPAR